MEVDPRLVRAFVAVAEEASFTRAAGRLFVTQQALSEQIRRLEREVGQALFVRNTRSVRLTAFGEELLPSARAVLAASARFERAVAGRAEVVPLHVDVAAADLLPDVVVAAARADGALLYRRTFGGFSASLPALLDGSLDVAFARSEGATRSFLDGPLARELIALEPLAVLRTDEQVPPGERVRLQDLKDVLQLLVMPAAELNDFFQRLYAEEHLTVPTTNAVEATVEEHVQLRLGAQRCSLILSTLPAAVRPLLRFVVDPIPLYPWCLIWRRDVEEHPSLQILRRTARRVARENGWLTLPAERYWIPAADRAAFDLPAWTGAVRPAG